MTDYFTDDELAIAAGQGWQLADVVDRGKPRLMILPSWQNPSVKTALVAQGIVVSLARVNGDEVAKRALRMVMSDLQREPESNSKKGRK